MQVYVVDNNTNETKKEQNKENAKQNGLAKEGWKELEESQPSNSQPNSSWETSESAESASNEVLNPGAGSLARDRRFFREINRANDLNEEEESGEKEEHRILERIKEAIRFSALTLLAQTIQ